MQAHSPDLIRYGITALVVCLVLFLRLRRVGKMQRLRLETMWIVPAIFFVIIGFIFYEMPPHGLGWLWCAVGLMLGAGVGWQRGRFIEIHVDPETHELNQRTSPAALIFLVALMGVRFALRYVMEMGDARWHLGALLVTGIFMSFALGVLTFYRVEMYLRARRLLAAARGR